MITFKQVRELWQARSRGVPFGDIAVMKFDMISKAPAGLNERLKELGNGYFDVNLEDLRQMPAGSLGREYVRMLDEKGLSPLEITPETREKFKNNPYPLRYTTTHDLFHVLTGFPTTPAGELGLLAFMIAQGFDVGSKFSLWSTLFAYAWIVPLHIAGMLHNMRLGTKMGKKANNLLLEPLELRLSEQIDVLRTELNLPDPTKIGMAQGHSSLLFDWIQKLSAPPQRTLA